MFFLDQNIFMDRNHCFIKHFWNPTIFWPNAIFFIQIFICFDPEAKLKQMSSLALTTQVLNSELENFCNNDCRSDSSPLIFILRV